jgi:hypothetical protein
MKDLKQQATACNSELSNIFDARNFKLLIRRFFGPSLAPPPEPTSPVELARILLQGQTENNAKPDTRISIPDGSAAP